MNYGLALYFFCFICQFLYNLMECQLLWHSSFRASELGKLNLRLGLSISGHQTSFKVLKIKRKLIYKSICIQLFPLININLCGLAMNKTLLNAAKFVAEWILFYLFIIEHILVPASSNNIQRPILLFCIFLGQLALPKSKSFEHKNQFIGPWAINFWSNLP